jgi:branched-chain amino acid transport system ATP-binding protein
MTTLHVDELSAWYGQAQALFDVSIDVHEGEVVGMIGHNGAGKSTFANSIASLHRRRTGLVQFGPVDLTTKSAHEVAVLGVSLVREGADMPLSLTVADNLRLSRRLAAKRGRQEVPPATVWEWFPLLRPLQNRRAGQLSGGERKALAVAMAFASQPTLVILDEPSAGLSPTVATQLLGVVSQLVSGGMTALVIEQNWGWLARLVTRTYMLEVGHLAGERSVAQVHLPALVPDGQDLPS